MCQRLVTLLHKPLLRVRRAKDLRLDTVLCGWLAVGLLVGWLVDWLTGFENDGRLSDYIRDKPLVKVGWAEGKGLASWHCVVWVAGWFVSRLVGGLAAWF